jgi:hypothetical protein
MAAILGLPHIYTRTLVRFQYRTGVLIVKAKWHGPALQARISGCYAAKVVSIWEDVSKKYWYVWLNR